MAQSRSVRVIRDTAYLTIGQFTVGPVGFVVSAWLARHLSVQELAVFPACISLISVVIGLSDLGMNNSFVRYVPRLMAQGDRAGATRILKTGLAVNFLCSAVLCVGLYLTRDMVNHLMLKGDAPRAALGMLTLAVFFETVAQQIWTALNGMQAYKRLAVMRTIGQICRSVLSLVLYFRWGIGGSMLGLAIGSLVGTGIGLSGLWPHLVKGSGFDPLGPILAKGKAFYASSILTIMRSRIDYIIVGAMGGAGPLATYFVAYKVFEYLWSISTSLMDTAATKIAEKAAREPDAMPRTFQRTSRYLFLGLVPMYLTAAAFSSAVVGLYAGAKYHDSGLVLMILCGSGIAGAISGLHRRYVIAVGIKWNLVTLDAFSALLSAVSIAGLMALMGPAGAAIAGVVTAVLTIPLAWRLLLPSFRPLYDWGAIVLGSLGGLLVLGACQLAIRLIPGAPGTIVGIALVIPIFLLVLRRRLQAADVAILMGLVPARFLTTERGVRFRGRVEGLLLPRSQA